ncbi:DNA circularization N-terminal domain-containing protein [Microvirga terricola]|uniref:DNA circulation N-terminal domain-containing protein n=1 Tax=Microvirga terricola TaxID=2719797 RepID=A0ABX0V6C6_9HYPH|nr:DNA circularization N-terminal domain-containing protein [Microvirga terricola]NIX75383.1 hypothetical protein [Microvirga terricola]
MTIFDHEYDLLPGLLPGAFRGVPFYVVDAGHDVGRRIVTSYFPGLDAKTHEDLGILDGLIDIAGLVIGDDYVAQAEALRRAFQTPGPGTLFHPWIGELTVILPQPARIDFSVTELRVARIQATFERTSAPAVLGLSTLTRLISTLRSVATAAQSLTAGLLSGRAVPMMFWTAARSMADSVVAVISDEVSRSQGSSKLLPAVDATKTALSSVDAMLADAAPAALAAAISTLADPIVDLASPAISRAIGLGGKPLPAAPSVLDARSVSSLLLRVGRTISTLEAFGMTDRAVAVLSQAAVVVGAGRLVSEVDFESRQEALRWRDQLDAALQQVGRDASLLMTENVGLAAQVWNTAEAARAALALDLNEVLGRLPSVRTITPPGTVSAFLLAQHLVGDDPRKVVAMAEDIRRRNRLHHPGSIPPEPLEVLL